MLRALSKPATSPGGSAHDSGLCDRAEQQRRLHGRRHLPVASDSADHRHRPVIPMPWRSSRTHGGQALVEFALVLVPLMLILAAILQFGLVLGTQVGITNAVREAARNAAASQTDTSALASANGHAVYVQLVGSTGLLAKNVQAYQSSQLVASGSPVTQVCYRTYTDPASTTQVMVKVEAHYRHPLLIPLISAILDGLDGSPDWAMRVGASEEIRVENPPSNIVPTLSSNPQCVTS